MQDQWGNPITSSLSDDKAHWVYGRVVDAMTIIYPATLSEADADVLALNSFNGMQPG